MTEPMSEETIHTAPVKRKSTPTYIYDRGRIRIAIWLRWKPWHFRVGLRKCAPGAWTGGFGFGMFTYMRRSYDR